MQVQRTIFVLYSEAAYRSVQVVINAKFANPRSAEKSFIENESIRANNNSFARMERRQREALDELLPLVHTELHRQAKRYLRRERAGHTLQTTALIHEAYLKLIGQKDVEWESRNAVFRHFRTIDAANFG